MIIVANKTTYKHDPDHHHVYIGRPSVLGNKWSSKSNTTAIHVSTREEAVALYNKWLRKNQHRPEIAKALNTIYKLHKQGKVVVLLCWCAPLLCHGDMIKQLIEEQ